MNQTKFNVFLLYKAFVIISLRKKSKPGVRVYGSHIFSVIFLGCTWALHQGGEGAVCVWLEKQAADSCVFMRCGWESQLWSADLQHKQERLCKYKPSKYKSSEYFLSQEGSLGSLILTFLSCSAQTNPIRTDCDHHTNSIRLLSLLLTNV